MQWIYNANNGRQMNKNMAWAQLECNHRVEVHPLDDSKTRCFQCQAVRDIRRYFCGNCGKDWGIHGMPINPCCGGGVVALPVCRAPNCNHQANWCSAGFCKKHSSDAQIRKALEDAQVKALMSADQINTIFEFAQRNVADGKGSARK